MSGLRNSARCTLFALCVAVLQLLLPLSAYAHMAANGLLTQEICSSNPTSVVADEVGAKLGGDTDNGVSSHAGAGHSCCVCSAPAFLAPPAAPVVAAMQAPNGVLRVGQTLVQYRAAVHIPPATGPPSRA